MADSTTNLDLLQSSQSGKEVTANEMFDAGSPAVLYGRRASTSAGLTWGYYGGKKLVSDGTLAAIANGTIALTASATNYLYATDAGVVTKATVAPAGWPGPLASDAKALYEIVTDASGVTSYTDYRTTGGGGGGSPLTTKGDLYGFSTTGDRVPVGANGQRLAADSTQALGVKWVNDPFYVHAQCIGAPSAGVFLLHMVAGCAITFPDDFAGSQAKARVAATASTVFDVQKNGVSIGSITFSAAGTVGAFTTSGGAVSLAVGDELTIVAPGSADATLATIAFALVGTR